MIRQFCLLVFLANLLNVHGSSECFIKLCNGTSTKEHYQNFTNSCNDSYLEERCCNATKGIIGLDLSNCSLETLEDVLTHFPDLEYLDLSDNPIQNCSKEYFKGLVSLNLLYLPSHCSICPGNISAWNNTEDGHCHIQNDACHYDNVYCSENGQCIPNGPGLAVCECLSGYFSYRCMRQGKFPYAMFTSLMITLTALLSVSLWYFIRRHTKIN